jgi:hypothetical protein
MENRIKECQADLFADRTPAPTMAEILPRAVGQGTLILPLILGIEHVVRHRPLRTPSRSRWAATAQLSRVSSDLPL